MKRFLTVLFPSRRSYAKYVALVVAIVALPIVAASAGDVSSVTMEGLVGRVLLVFAAFWPLVVAYQIGSAGSSGMLRHYLRFGSSRFGVVLRFAGYAGVTSVLGALFVSLASWVTAALLGFAGGSWDVALIGYFVLVVFTSLLAVPFGLLFSNGVIAALLVLLVPVLWDIALGSLPWGSVGYLQVFDSLASIGSGGRDAVVGSFAALIMLCFGYWLTFLGVSRRWY